MNQYLEEYIRLKNDFELKDGDKSSVSALYQFADRLSVIEVNEVKEILVDVYIKLGMIESAYLLFSTIVDKDNRKQMKKLALLQKQSKSHGNEYALPRPMSDEEKAERRKRLKDIPPFRYHPDPIGNNAFEEGEPQICPCCGRESDIYYAFMPYCIDNVEHLCPICISNGKAAKKYDATFVQGAEVIVGFDKEKDDELFRRTPGYVSWQGEYWLSCCNDYCAYLGTVGTRELKAMDIADEVLREYAARSEFEDIEEYLIKDGPLCGYLFQCLHCGKYHIWVDAD